MKGCDLYIAEKPEVAGAIAKVINPNAPKKKGFYDCGGNVIVTWAIGHLLALKDPDDFNPEYKKWSLAQLPLRYGVQYKPNPKTSAQLRAVLDLVKSAATIYVATDIDAAGQAIGDEILEYANIDPRTVNRVLINDNNPTKIAKAIHPSSIKSNADFEGLFLQEKSRSIADQRLGYNLTRALSCQSQKQGLKKTLNVGRVQSAILGLVVRRERSRKSHVKRHYHNITSAVNTSCGELKGRLKLEDNSNLELDEKGRLSNEGQVIQLVRSLHGQNAIITKVEHEHKYDSPPLPYDLLTLQIDCSRLFDFSADDVLEYTQKLRESPYYAISYNRSDCRYIEDDNFSEAPTTISNLSNTLLEPIASKCDSTIKSRAFNSDKTGAHGAIIPTGSITGFDEMPDELKVVYILIARNYLLQFLPKRERHVTKYEYTIKSSEGFDWQFVGKSQKVLEPGWAAVFQNDAESEDAALDDVEEVDMTNLPEGESIASANVQSQAKETKPLASYTNATLLKDLKSTAKYITDPTFKKWMLAKDKGNDGEQGGIGTAATRASIVKGLFDNGFLMVDPKKKVIPTQDGEFLFDMLPERITLPETTALWSHHFKEIEEGRMGMADFLSEIDATIEAEIENIKRNGLKIPPEMIPKKVVSKCPFCERPEMKLIPAKRGKYSAFWKCNECEKTASDDNGKPFKKSCPTCREPLKIVTPKDPKKKQFISCSAFPKCTYKEWPK